MWWCVDAPPPDRTERGKNLGPTGSWPGGVSRRCLDERALMRFSLRADHPRRPARRGRVIEERTRLLSSKSSRRTDSDSDTRTTPEED